ncbi:MAG: hypothetical protein ACPGJV_02550 [Bacteriovoracaceae bacterium]
MINLIGEIILEGLKAWNEERRTRFKDKHQAILKRIDNAVNATGEDYYDSEVDLSEEELETFMKSYLSEVKSINKGQ